MVMLFILLFLCTPLFADLPKVTYSFSTAPIDVVIPCAPKDLDTLELCIQGVQTYGQNIRRVIVVSKERLTNSAEWFDEQNYPFSIRDIAFEIFEQNDKRTDFFLTSPRNRSGWIFQQFLKFYAPFVIPGISENVLILDSDVIFLHPMQFMTDSGAPCFNTGSELYSYYFTHAQKLLPDLRRVYPQYSGICHYMLFQRPILEDLFALIKAEHHIEPWKALARCIDQGALKLSCLSEYEIYFNFTQLRTDQSLIRPLKWIQLGKWDQMESLRSQHFFYMACQEWIRSCASGFMEIHQGLEPKGL
jgi:hypothetical protein